MCLIPQWWGKKMGLNCLAPTPATPLSSLPPPGMEAMPITELSDRRGVVLTAEPGAAEGFINTSSYWHLAARERHRRSTAFIGAILSLKEMIVMF